MESLINMDCTNMIGNVSGKCCKNFQQVEKALLFGSRAKGNYKNGADVDIAICGPDVTMQMGWEIAHILNEDYPLPYFFDVVDYTYLKDKALREHIENFGVVIYEKVAVK